MSNLSSFVVELERILKSWPERAPWAVSQIAMYTQMDGKLVANWMGVAMGRPLDIQDRLSFAEGEQIYEALKDIVEKGEHLPGCVDDGRNKSSAAFASMRKKLAPFLQAKNWRQAYKNLNYFMGEYGPGLPVGDKLEAYAELLRIGSKADISAQELAVWLTNGVDASLEDQTARGVDDAIDLIDAYGDLFIDAAENEFLNGLFDKISVFAKQHTKESALKECIEQLFENG